MVPLPDGQQFVDWLYQWQTLVGAALALIAAILTILVMNGQRRDETRRYVDAEKRKRMAARASMPDALSDLTAYVEGCAARLVGSADTLPDQPAEAIGTLKLVIEFMDDAAASRAFELVSLYQVYRSRMSSGIPSPQHPELHDRLYDTALLQAYVNSLYGYARNETDKVATSEPTRAEMLSALRNAVGLVNYVRDEQRFSPTVETINRRHPQA